MSRTLTDEQIATVARRHEAARRSATPIDRVTKTYPSMTIDDAYAIQRAWVELQTADGDEIMGYKIGLTSRAMQQSMKISEPDFGALLDSMVLQSGSTVPAAQFIDPKVEVELAFVLAHDLDGSNVTERSVLEATQYIVPALELIDARSYRIDPVDGVSRTVCDTISDNAADAGIVLGELHIDALDVLSGNVDLRWVSAAMRRNGIVEETGVAIGVLGDPVLGIVWLARRLHGLGVTLRAGHTVLAGSFTRPIDARQGDEFEVDYNTYGTVRIGFS